MTLFRSNAVTPTARRAVTYGIGLTVMLSLSCLQTPSASARDTLSAAPSVAKPRAATKPVAKKPAPVRTSMLTRATPTLETFSAKALDSFFASLHKAQRRDKDGRVLITQFGDSHTAGDNLTMRMRKTLQARFGNAGRGFLLAGKPMRHYYQQGARYGTRGRWICERGGRRKAAEPFGYAGVRVRTHRKNAKVWVGTCTNCRQHNRVSRFEVFFGRSSGNGRVAYRVDNKRWRSFDTRKARKHKTVSGYKVIKVKEGSHTLTLRPLGNGPVDLFGVALEREGPGVIVDSLGRVGLMAQHLYKMDWTVIGEQLAHRDPRLVVLQYGTNETYDDDLKVAKVEKMYVELVGRIRKAVPKASILILGPPDVGMRELGRACDRPRRRYKRRARKLRRKRVRSTRLKPGAPVVEGCQYRTPKVLPEIIAAQRRAARRTGVAFFDSFAAMGGADMMALFNQQEPKLAYGDHVHFTQRGAELWADLLLAQLMQSYDKWLRKNIRRARK